MFLLGIICMYSKWYFSAPAPFFPCFFLFFATVIEVPFPLHSPASFSFFLLLSPFSFFWSWLIMVWADKFPRGTKRKRGFQHQMQQAQSYSMTWLPSMVEVWPNQVFTSCYPLCPELKSTHCLLFSFGDWWKCATFCTYRAWHSGSSIWHISIGWWWCTRWYMACRGKRTNMSLREKIVSEEGW